MTKKSSKINRDSFVFYRSFYESISGLSDKQQLEVYKAISSYALNGELIDLGVVANAIFCLAKPSIDSNQRRYENGLKGAEHGKKGGRPKTPKKPLKNPKLTPRKPQINPKLTPYVDEDVSVSVSEDVSVSVSEEINTPTGKPSKLCDDFHFEMANSLGDFIETSKQINIKPTQRKTWANDIRLLMTRDISNWFDICSQQDLVIAQGCVDYKNEISTSRFYRQLFDKNQLPDLYNGITYFKKSKTAEEFFKLVRYIFEHWEDFRSTLKYCAMSEPATTDIVYAIATLCIGEEKCLLPNSVNPLKWAHMKPRIINTFSDDWTKECFFEILNSGQVRVNSYSQYYPLHYIHKHLANHFEKYYD